MDDNMKAVEHTRESTTSSPPRKKIKSNGQHFTFESNHDPPPKSTVPNSLTLKINAHQGECNSISFLKNSPYLITGGKENTVKLWNTSTGLLSHTLQGFQGSVYDLAIHPNDDFIVAALSSHKLCIWDIKNQQLHRILSGHNQLVNSVDIGKSSGKYIVSSSNDHLIKLWDFVQNDHFPICTSYVDSICKSICFTFDENIICLGHGNGKITLMDSSRDSMGVNSVIEAHTQSVTSICCLQNRNLVLSSGRDKLHNLVDSRMSKICWKFKTKCNKVGTNRSRTCICPDDNFVVVGSADGTVSIWSLRMGKMVETLKGHNGSVLDCSWSKSGNLASADYDGNVCIWS